MLKQDIKAACILEVDSYHCLKYECSLEQLNLSTWKQQIDEIRADFLIVESAQEGLNHGWRGPLDQNELLGLVTYCKQRSIPTIFWETDDSSNYGKFIEVAKLFDYIFAVDEKAVAYYKTEVSHDNIYWLPFAAQPQIHNPLQAHPLNKEQVELVKTSPASLPRRVFELLASGTVVLNHYSKTIEKLFKGIIPVCHSEKDVKGNLLVLLNNPEYVRRLSLIGLREVHLKHLYKHRLNSILETVGFKTEINQEGVSIIVCTKRAEFMENVLENYLKQSWGKKELVVILNNDNMEINDWKEKASHCPDLFVYQLSEKTSLGECLNFGVSKTNYNFIAKFDDDDYYGSHFLLDLMHAFDYSEADIVGKLCHYAYLESMKALVVRFSEYEHKFTNFLVGSFIVKKDVLNKVKFDPVSVGEISIFLKNCRSLGYKIYAADRYNYVYIRRNHHEHSWQRTANQILEESKCSFIAFTEDYKTHATV